MSSVLVAMSGGVDSSVAAARLVEAGHDVAGVTLKLWGGDSDSGCCSVADVEDARRVAAQLDIPHYVFNLTDAFTNSVVEPYVTSHTAGETPNPCVECNRAIKFGVLLDRASALGFDTVATGHHARVARDANGSHRLLRGADRAKDQSYVLYMLGQRELVRVWLPVGELTKAAVRAEAARLGLRTAAKPESMDVCFITRGDRTRFLAERTELVGGPIIDAAGTVIGDHDGYARFTVGQRRGLGIAAGDRRYVVDVDPGRATVTVGTRDDLLRSDVVVRDLRFCYEPPTPGAPVVVQTRAHGTPVPASLDGDLVRFDWPQPRVAPGQVVAFYDGDVVLGGGIAA